MFNTPGQLIEMQKLIDYHLENHSELQVLQAIQEMNELSKELSKYLINKELNKPINYLDIYNELFDAEIMLITMYKKMVADKNQQDIFRLVSDQKIQREKDRWGIE